MRSPVTPSKGARISVRARSTSASAKRALAWSKRAIDSARRATDETSLFAKRSVRSRMSWASRTAARASCTRATCSPSRIRNNTSPSETGCPSTKSIDSITPSSSGLITTWLSEFNCPVRATTSRRTCGSMVITSTVTTSSSGDGRSSFDCPQPVDNPKGKIEHARSHNRPYRQGVARVRARRVLIKSRRMAGRIVPNHPHRRLLVEVRPRRRQPQRNCLD